MLTYLKEVAAELVLEILDNRLAIGLQIVTGHGHHFPLVGATEKAHHAVFVRPKTFERLEQGVCGVRLFDTAQFEGWGTRRGGGGGGGVASKGLAARKLCVLKHERILKICKV